MIDSIIIKKVKNLAILLYNMKVNNKVFHDIKF